MEGGQKRKQELVPNHQHRLHHASSLFERMKRADEFYSKGQDYYQRGIKSNDKAAFLMASRSFSNAIANGLDSAEVYTLKGLCGFGLYNLELIAGQPEKALEHVLSATRCYSEAAKRSGAGEEKGIIRQNEAICHLLAGFLAYKLGYDPAKEEDFKYLDVAFSELHAALRGNLTQPEVFESLGDIYERMRDFRNAEKFFQHAERLRFMESVLAEPPEEFLKAMRKYGLPHNPPSLS